MSTEPVFDGVKTAEIDFPLPSLTARKTTLPAEVVLLSSASNSVEHVREQEMDIELGYSKKPGKYDALRREYRAHHQSSMSATAIFCRYQPYADVGGDR
ncbi:MAG: hypothetical protein VB878_25665 [Pirellulaceae bacterium]